MTKSIDVLPTWYWPDGVPRRASLPDVTVADRVVRRWVRRRADEPALVGADGTVTYQRLGQLADGIAASLAGRAAGVPTRIAVAVADPVRSLILAMGALRTGAQVLLAAPDQPELARAVTRFGAQVSVIDAPTAVPLAVAESLDASALLAQATHHDEGGAHRHDPRRPAITLLDGEHLVHHSEVSALRAGHALGAFLSLGPHDRVLVDTPAASWEHLVGALGVLDAGGALVGSQPPPQVASDVTLWWVDVGHVPRIVDEPPGWLRPGATILVSVREPMPVRLRRQLRRRTHARVLTIFGTAATGPIAASAPAWHLDDAVGIAVTDVDIVPVDPGSRAVAVGPWVLLDHAAVAARTPARALEIEGVDHDPFVDDAYDTGVLGRIDANGMLYLL
jgi:hypothetical protein